MDVTAERISLWIAVVFGAIMLVAFLVFPGFFPPMAPDWSAAHVARFYAAHTGAIRASMVTFNFCGIMLVPLYCVIVQQLKRMQTPTQVLSWCYLSAAVSGATLFAIADLFWLVAAFRPERSPDLIQLLNDFAWIVFTAPVGMIVAQNLCLAIAIYLDAGPNPVFPRWVGHFAIVVALAIAPSAAAAAIHTGPLAWNGAISFYLRIGSYAAFLIVMFFMLRRALDQEATAA